MTNFKDPAGTKTFRFSTIPLSKLFDGSPLLFCDLPKGVPFLHRILAFPWISWASPSLLFPLRLLRFTLFGVSNVLGGRNLQHLLDSKPIASESVLLSDFLDTCSVVLGES